MILSHEIGVRERISPVSGLYRKYLTIRAHGMTIRTQEEKNDRTAHWKASQPVRSQPTGLIAVIPMLVEASPMIELVSKADGGNLQARDRSQCSPPPLLQTYFPIWQILNGSSSQHAVQRSNGSRCLLLIFDAPPPQHSHCPSTLSGARRANKMARQARTRIYDNLQFGISK